MGSYASLLPPKPIICKMKCICNYLKCHYIPSAPFYTSHHQIFRIALCCPMCSFEFQYCQETAPRGAAVLLLPTWPMPRFGGAGGWQGGSSAPLPRTVWTPWMARLRRSQNEELLNRECLEMQNKQVSKRDASEKKRGKKWAASEGKKWMMMALSRTPGWLGMGLLLLQLWNNATYNWGISMYLELGNLCRQ